MTEGPEGERQPSLGDAVVESMTDDEKRELGAGVRKAFDKLLGDQTGANAIGEGLRSRLPEPDPSFRDYVLGKAKPTAEQDAGLNRALVDMVKVNRQLVEPIDFSALAPDTRGVDAAMATAQAMEQLLEYTVAAEEREREMFKWTKISGVSAIIAGVLGFGGIVVGIVAIIFG